MPTLPPAPGVSYDVGGTTLHALTAGLDITGRAPAVVLHSGLLSPAFAWFKVLPLIGAFAPAFAIDRPGYGWSDPAPAALPRTAAQSMEATRAFLRAAGQPPPYVLVGHSYGAILCLLHAYRYPQEVAGMVLADPSHPRQMQAQGMPSTRLYRWNVGIIGQLVKWPVGRGMGRLIALQMLLSVRARMSPSEWETAVALFQQPAFFAAALEEVGTLEESLLAADGPPGSLGALPFTLLEADDWYSARSRPMRVAVRALRQEMLTLSTRATYERVPHTNHVTLPLLAPERVAAAVKATIDG